MSINSIKQSLQDVLKTVPGVNAVYTGVPKDQRAIYPSITILTPKIHERVKTSGNPGRRHINYTFFLGIQNIDPNPDEFASQSAFNDILDSIDTALRNNKDLNGTVLMSAWEYIDTDVFEPQLTGNGMSILLRAIKTFDVLVEITG